MKKFIFILAASFSLLGSGVLAGKDCTNTSTRATHLGPNTAALDEDRVSPLDGYCYHTPQTMKLKFTNLASVRELQVHFQEAAIAQHFFQLLMVRL